MSADSVGCVGCVKMDWVVVDGLPKDYFDRPSEAEDAYEFELQLAEARDVKYTTPVELQVGSHIVCTGTPCEDIPWFAIDLKISESEDPVHFNVRMPQVCVVRNTKRKGKWGVQEMTSFRRFPFKVGRKFTIEILIDEKETRFAVDGLRFCEYTHRNPSPFSAQVVEVSGVRDAEVVVQVKPTHFPLTAPSPQQVPVIQSKETPIEELTWAPHTTAALSNGVPEGHQIVVRGRLRPMPYSFTLNLMDAPYDWPTPNKLLHVNFRLYDEPQKDRQLVVFNSYLEGAWGTERRQRNAKLVPGTVMTLRILCNPAHWTVYQDSMQIGELEHRADPNKVNSLQITGDFYPDLIYLEPATAHV